VTFDWAADSDLELFLNLTLWFFWSLLEIGVGRLKDLGSLPATPAVIGLLIVACLGTVWLVLKLIKPLLVLVGLVAIGAIAIRTVVA